MRKKMSNLIAVGLIGSCVLSGFSVSSLAAQEDTNPQAVAVTQPTHQGCVKRIIEIVKHKKGHWNLGLYRDKHLTSDDAKIIAEAALLMHGRKDLHVGDIQSKLNSKGKTVYQIAILDGQNKTVSLVDMSSSSGHIHPIRIGD